MKTSIILWRTAAMGVMVAVLGGCTRKMPQQVLDTTNRQYKLDLLFEHDGCKVYRFHDGGQNVYWTDCRGKIETAHVERDVNQETEQVVRIQNITTTADSSRTGKN